MRDIWNDYLKDIRRNVIAMQKHAIPTEADKQLIGRCLFFLTDFAGIVREDVMLAIENEAAGLHRDNKAEELLYKAAMLIADGMTVEYTAEVLSNEYWSGDWKDYEATAAYLCIRGSTAILEGTNPWLLKQMLTSILPAGIRESSIEVCSKMEEKHRAERNADKNKAASLYFEMDFSRSESTAVRNALSWLEEQLLKMQDEKVQELLRSVDNMYLVPALVGMKKEPRAKIAQNMSSRLRNLIMQDCYRLSDIDDEAILEGAEYITRKIKTLH